MINEIHGSIVLVKDCYKYHKKTHTFVSSVRLSNNNFYDVIIIFVSFLSLLASFL